MSPVRPPKLDFCAQTLFSYAFLVFLAPLWPRMLVIMEKWSQIAVISEEMVADCCYNGETVFADEDNVP